MPNTFSTAIMIAIVVVVGGVLLAIIALTRGHGKVLNKERYRTAWLEIDNNIDRNNLASYQFAILSADKLLDKALRESGIAGQTMGDRLKKSNKLFSDINGVWAAHKVRNRIAHEVDGSVNKSVATRMLAIYKKALRDLGAI